MEKPTRQWRKKAGRYLFPVQNLARVFRARWFEAMRISGLSAIESVPAQWVVDCQAVGRGDKALLCLGRYLYRGVIREQDIIADQDGNVTFRYTENSGAIKTRTLSGGEFLWLLLQHVLPKRFRRVRDYGFLHGNGKRLVQLLRLLLRVVTPERQQPSERAPVLCPHCGHAMTIIATRLRLNGPMLC